MDHKGAHIAATLALALGWAGCTGSSKVQRVERNAERAEELAVRAAHDRAYFGVARARSTARVRLETLAADFGGSRKLADWMGGSIVRRGELVLEAALVAWKGKAPPSLVRLRIAAASVGMNLERGCITATRADPLAGCLNALLSDRLGGPLWLGGGRIDAGRLKVLLAKVPATPDKLTLLAAPARATIAKLGGPARDYLEVWRQLKQQPGLEQAKADFASARETYHSGDQEERRSEAMIDWYRRYTATYVSSALLPCEDDESVCPPPRASYPALWHTDDQLYVPTAFWLRRLHDGSAQTLADLLEGWVVAPSTAP